MTTYYVVGAGGSDVADGLTEGNGWATIDHAMNTAQTAGDHVYVKATGTYSETPNIDVAGSLASHIIYEGYTSTTGDNGKVTISGTTNCLTTTPAGAQNYTFRNFIFSGASSDGVSMFGADSMIFYNCEFNSNGGRGIRVDDQVQFINCVAHSNTGDGIESGEGVAAGCITYGNGGIGLDYGNGSKGVVYKCVSYNNTGDQMDLSAPTFVGGCTVDGEGTKLGIRVDNLLNGVVIDCIAYDCTTGIDNPASWSAFMGYNLLNSNTTDYTNTGSSIGVNDITSAPAFTDEANDDYTLGEASPAIGAGLTPGGIT